MPFSAVASIEPCAKREQRNLFAWGLLSAVVLIGLMAIPLYLNRVATRDDLGCFHLPLRQYYAAQLARGESFDWMPQLFGGFYLTGEGQIGTYHPLHWFLYRCLRLEGALTLEYLASYPVLLAGTYWLLRRRRLRRGAAMFGALTFAFGGFNLLHFVHPNAVAIVAHIPWLLALIDVVWCDSSTPRVTAAATGIASATGSQLLLGYPQYVWFSLLAEAGFAVWLTMQSAGFAKRRWLTLIGAKLLGLLIGAIQLAPTAEMLQRSVRHAVDAQFTNLGALHPLNLVQLIAPYLFADRAVGGNTHESGLYVGTTALMLLVWLRCRQRPLGTWRPLVLACVILGGVSFALALGSAGVLYRLQRLLPLVGGFRCPCRYLVLCHLAVAVLAAVGFVLLSRQTARREVSAFAELRPLWIVTGLSVVVTVVGLLMQGHPLLASPGRVLLGPLVVAMAATLVSLAARGRRWALPALVVFTAVDLGSYGLSYAVYPDTWTLADYVQCVALPPERPQPSERLVGDLLPPGSTGPYIGNQLLLAGWSRADGYAGLMPQRQLDYRQVAALRVAGVHWVGSTDRTRSVPGLVEHDSGWLQVPRPLPRARLTTHTLTSRQPALDLQRIAVETTALVEAPLVLPESQPGSVAIVSDRPGRMELTVDCPAQQLLTVAESYHPGWQASCAGRRLPVLRVNGDFLGCLVNAGRQTVVLDFRPDSLRLGKWLSLLGLGITGTLLVGGQLARRTTNLPRLKETLP